MSVVSDYTALLSSFSWWWSGNDGTPVFITYSFETSSPDYHSDAGFSAAYIASFAPLSAAEKSLAEDALDFWADASGIVFLEVPAGQGDIRFAKYDFTLDAAHSGFAGFAYFPSITLGSEFGSESLLGGDIFLTTEYMASIGTIAHEIGHALGFKHPFEGDTTLDPSLDMRDKTVLSYTGSYLSPFDLGYLDYDAVEYQYGTAASDGSHLASYSWDSVGYKLTQTGGAGADIVRGVAVVDIISTFGGDDTVFGGGGNDTIMGGAGSDRLFGGRGNDLIFGGSEDDTLNGGDGNDALAGDGGDDYFIGGDGNDSIYGGAGADSLYAFDGNDMLFGGPGGDVLFGYEGDDTLEGGPGADYLNGNEDIDTVSYASSTSSVTVELWRGFGTAGDALSDTFVEIENIIGSLAGDVLAGNAGANKIDGGPGADLIYAGGGDDTLIGGPGADLLNGKGGTDTADYSTAGAAVTAELWRGTGTRGDASGDVFDSIENVVGSAFGDLLAGNGGANVLTGLAGLDALVGGGGDDTLNGGLGADTLIGGGGTDTASYADATGAVTAELWRGTGTRGEATGDTFTTIENLIGGNFGDLLAGDGGKNVLDGGLGADALIAGGGSDTLIGGAGADTLHGGGGADTASYAGAAAGVTAELWRGSGTGGEASGDTYTSIEHLIGSSFGDTLAGNGANNVLNGAGGDDVLIAGGGDDTLLGGGGDDTLYGQGGDDLITYLGGGGADVIAGFTAGAGTDDVIKVLAGPAFDTFSEIMGAASQSGADVLIDFGGGNSIRLVGVTLASLDADDFIFS